MYIDCKLFFVYKTGFGSIRSRPLFIHKCIHTSSQLVILICNPTTPFRDSSTRIIIISFLVRSNAYQLRVQPRPGSRAIYKNHSTYHVTTKSYISYSVPQARRKQFGIGGGGDIPGGSPSRGSDVMSKNVWKCGGGGRRKICITTTLTRYMQTRGTFFKVEY